MASRGDDFLKNLLGHDSSQTIHTASNTTGGAPPAPRDVPRGPGPHKPTAEERNQRSQEEIEAEAEQKRQEEKDRVDPWHNIFNFGEEPKPGKAGSGPGGYTFSREVALKKISEWESLYEELKADGLQIGQAMRAIQPPSGDAPAHEQADAAKASIKAAADHNLVMQAYAQRYIEALQTAAGTYVKHDDAVYDTLGKGPSSTGSLYT
ncbi:hypothetical protein AB5J62_37835 [Amycolatopsis sp. cg5]|uniref:hypothetical protein n=1 Tax=Amycolatopsis sp. cg5 TaxID=3238802 RepID=UPI003524A319